VRLARTVGFAAVLFAPLVAIGAWRALAGVPEPAPGAWTRPLAERARDPFPRTFHNALGERVAIQTPPQRIVSATVFSDAVLLDACPHERIAALHVLSEDPRFSPIVARSRAFARHTTGEPEDILAARPDLVILSSFSRRETVQLVAGHGRAVVRLTRFDSIADIQTNLRALGYVLGLDREVEALVEAMQRRLDAVGQRRAQRTRWRVLQYEDGHASGAGTTFASMLEWIGARNVAGELGLRGFQPIGVESLLLADPDVLVIGCLPGEEAERRAQLLQVPAFHRLRAVREDRLLFVEGALLQAACHHVAGAVERIAARLDAWARAGR
jgi:iron complex transport system substrate-binding protein